jgi:hypothetical protein
MKRSEIVVDLSRSTCGGDDEHALRIATSSSKAGARKYLVVFIA